MLLMPPMRQWGFVRKLADSSFARSVGVLVGGTAAAHFITALTLPLSTRLYSPADFSVLAVFVGMVSIISVAACLRFDVAVPLPEADGDALNLLALALLSSCAISGAVGLAVWLVPARFFSSLIPPALQPWLWLIPVGVFVASSYSALQCWFVRRKAFRAISTSRIGQSAFASLVQVGMGFMGVAPLGLLLGFIMNSGAGVFALGLGFFRADKHLLRALSWARMREMLSAYQRFPKYSTFEALCNSAAMQVPLLIIASVAIGPEAGYLMLASFVMQAPLALVGNSIAQVYLSRAPDEHRAGQLGQFTTTIFAGLLKVGVGPLIFAGIVSPVAFALIFGSAWQRAGVLVSWMTPWFVLQFLATPLSMALHIAGRQGVAFALQLLGMVFRIGAVVCAGAFASDYVAEVYAVTGFVFYLTYLLMVLRVVRTRPADVMVVVVSSVMHIVAWIAVGAVVLCLWIFFLDRV